MTLELHPLSTLFPRITGAEFEALAQDIRINGLREPITLHDGMVLDGGNRYRACLEAGVEPTFRDFAGDSIVAFVLSANLHRRHLSPGQQAAIVASAQDWASAHVAGSNQHTPKAESGPAILPDLQTVAGRAAQSGVSERTQRMADKVAKAAPDLARQVAHGAVSLPAAVEQVTGKRPGGKPVTQEAHPTPDEDLHEMLADMQRECESYARRLADWERAMQADGKQALVTAIKRYEHAERGKAMTDERASTYMRQRDEALRRIKQICKLVGEDDPDKVVAAVRKAVQGQEA